MFLVALGIIVLAILMTIKLVQSTVVTNMFHFRFFRQSMSPTKNNESGFARSYMKDEGHDNMTCEGN